jgi:hypothetical protein
VHTQRERRNKPNIRQSELSHIKLLLILILKDYLKKRKITLSYLLPICITLEYLSYHSKVVGIWILYHLLKGCADRRNVICKVFLWFFYLAQACGEYDGHWAPLLTCKGLNDLWNSNPLNPLKALGDLENVTAFMPYI